MQDLITSIRTFISDEDGVTAVEYGLLCALIAIVIIVSVQTVGTQLNSTFSKIGSYLTSANG